MSLVEARIPIPVAAAEAVENALAEAENAEWGVFEDRPTASAWLGSYFPDAASATAAAPRARPGLRRGGALAEPAISPGGDARRPGGFWRRADGARDQRRAGSQPSQ